MMNAICDECDDLHAIDVRRCRGGGVERDDLAIDAPI
jgi:hypothetical protein